MLQYQNSIQHTKTSNSLFMMRCFDGLVQADEYLNTYSLISQSSFDAESHFVAIWSIYGDKNTFKFTVRII